MRVGIFSKNRSGGFTIVELLIVIVVIGILASIVIVAYNGVQGRARDSRRQNDIQAITHALELYYIDNNRYPPSANSTTINSTWSTTADASWSYFTNHIKPYISNPPSDPISTPNVSPTWGSGYNYAYYSNTAGASCGVGANQAYLLVYRLEAAAQTNNLDGDCSTAPLIPPYANASNYRVVKN